MTTAAEQDHSLDHHEIPEGRGILGEIVFELFGDVRELISVAFRTVYYSIFRRPNMKSIVEQMYAIGNESLFFMVVTMVFIGAIIAFQMGTQTKRIIPDMSIVGAMYLKLLIRELAPSVGALPLATRVGAGIAAQIGSMVVTDQTDAMRMCGADPVEYLIVPRFIASTIMGVVILLIGGAVAWVSGGMVMYLLYDVNFATFVNANQVTWGDCAAGFTKAISYGGVLAIISGYRGLSTFGGSEGVGIATTNAVVGSLFMIIMLNLVISAISYFIFPA